MARVYARVNLTDWNGQFCFEVARPWTSGTSVSTVFRDAVRSFDLTTLTPEHRGEFDFAVLRACDLETGAPYLPEALRTPCIVYGVPVALGRQYER